MAKPKSIATSATAILAALWEERFFKTWRTAANVDAHIAKDGYHFSAPELGMALMRARFLTRKGSRGSYQYIQKFPFTNDFKRPGRKAKAKRK